MFKTILSGVTLGFGALFATCVGIISWVGLVVILLVPWMIKIGIIAGLFYVFLRLFGVV